MASKAIYKEIPHNGEYLSAVIMLVNASVALLLDIRGSFMPSGKATLEYPAYGVLAK